MTYQRIERVKPHVSLQERVEELGVNIFKGVVLPLFAGVTGYAFEGDMATLGISTAITALTLPFLLEREKRTTTPITVVSYSMGAYTGIMIWQCQQYII